MLRLIVFELLIGQRLAFMTLWRRHGVSAALHISATVAVRLCCRNPFRSLPAARNAAERASRQQLAPALILFDVLRERGLSEQAAIAEVGAVVMVVAKAFLAYNIPKIPAAADLPPSPAQRLVKFRLLCRRFFNAQGHANAGSDHFSFTVHHCLFASYCRQLGYASLASVFCQADRAYFEQQQSHVIFARSQTLADGGSHCDFSFTLKP